MRTDGFRNRYLIKVGSSIIIAIINIIIQVLLPRAFSVEEYGYYTYNLNVFTSVVLICNFSASDAMVAKFSKRNEEIGLIYFYLKFYAIVAVILCAAVMALYPSQLIQGTFAGQTLLTVMLGLVTAIINKLLSDSISIYDAFAVSRFPAVIQMILKAVISAFVVAAYFAGRLSLTIFYVFQGIITIFFLFVLLYAIIKDQRRRYPNVICKSTREYIREYYTYCKPLVIATVVAQAVIIIMNWALMHWSGATQQAMFGAAWQMNTLVGYIFSPYAELSKREFAVLYNDKNGLTQRFTQALKLMMWLTCYFAIFIGILGNWIIPVVYGDKYTEAYGITVIIMYYTVYQAWGQISGSYMLALEETRKNAIFTILGQALTLGFVFLFQIPNFIWPKSLGAIGIGLNYLLVNFITTIMKVCVIYKELNQKLFNLLKIQIIPIGLCAVLSIVLKYGIGGLIASSSARFNLLKILISGVIYTLVIGAVLYKKPEIAGLTSESIMSLRESIKRKLTK